MSIAVTGAAGELGRLVIKNLKQKAPVTCPGILGPLAAGERRCVKC